MKKILSGLAALLLISLFGFNQEVNAQVTADDDATVSATVQAPIVVTNLADIVFGNIVLDTTALLDPEDRSNDSNVGNDAELGKFSISGTPGALVTITFPASVTLEHDTDNDELTFTPTAARTNNSDDEVGSVAVLTGGNYNINQTTDGTNIVAGTDFVFVGGSIVVPNGIATGSYEGTFTLTASYN